MDLKNKVAIVTGGSSGIGQAICMVLAKDGCKVIFTYNSNPKGAGETLKSLGNKGQMFKVDFRREGGSDELFKIVKKKYGRVDILVNNAGVNRPRGLFNVDDWREIFILNLFSVVDFTGKAVELMNGQGRILNISSIYAEGKACFKGIAPYGAAKAALNHFTQMLAKNLAPGILVNAIAPGYVKTPLWKNTSESDFVEAGKEQLIERMIEPDEVADLSVAVLKNDAMTGEVVVIDGGISLKTV